MNMDGRLRVTMDHTNEFSAMVSKLGEWMELHFVAKHKHLEAHKRHDNSTPGWAAFFMGWDHATNPPAKRRLIPTPGSIARGYYKAGKLAGRDWQSRIDDRKNS
jgi:hypothetical protein